MTLLEYLKTEAVKRGLLAPEADLDAATAFRLVRDMPYQRASDRRPQTTLREWRGTCSGKHYLLAALFRELGLEARVMAGVLRFRPDPKTTPPEFLALLAPADGVFVDVHNWVAIDLPSGPMIVDATWPLSVKKYGLPVNETFVLGKSQQLAYSCEKVFVVPEEGDPQAFKQKLLHRYFTPAELSARDAFIRALSEQVSAAASQDE